MRFASEKDANKAVTTLNGSELMGRNVLLSLIEWEPSVLNVEKTFDDYWKARMEAIEGKLSTMPRFERKRRNKLKNEGKEPVKGKGKGKGRNNRKDKKGKAKKKMVNRFFPNLTESDEDDVPMKEVSMEKEGEKNINSFLGDSESSEEESE